MNIGNPHEVTMLDLARTIVRLCDSASEVRFVERPVDDPMVRKPDVSLALAELDWRAQIPFEEGLRRTIADLAAADGAASDTVALPEEASALAG
jgi:dTDP-glucose 4,6-dehydratase